MYHSALSRENKHIYARAPMASTSFYQVPAPVRFEVNDLGGYLLVKRPQ